MISKFLENHKRGCPANVGQNCNCDLFLARDELAAKDAALAAASGKRAALSTAQTLLMEAMTVFDGEQELCDDPNTSAWIWKWRVRYYFNETDIPPHPMPEDMK